MDGIRLGQTAVNPAIEMPDYENIIVYLDATSLTDTRSGGFPGSATRRQAVPYGSFTRCARNQYGKFTGA